MNNLNTKMNNLNINKSNKSTNIEGYDIKHMDTRIITIKEYEPDKTHDITIYKFVDLVNYIISSKNVLDICNNLNCHNFDMREKATEFCLIYKNIFHGKNMSASSRDFLQIINCDVKPIINTKTYKSVSYIKWKIYESNKKKNISKEKENDLAEWIGALAGILLYFDELDEINFNNTTYYRDICKPFTIYDV